MEVNSFPDRTARHGSHDICSESTNSSSFCTSFGLSNVYTPSNSTIPSLDEIDAIYVDMLNSVINNEINQFTIPTNLNQADITAQLLEEITSLMAIRSETNSLSSGDVGFSSRSDSSYLSASVFDVKENYKETLTSVRLFDDILSTYNNNVDQV